MKTILAYITRKNMYPLAIMFLVLTNTSIQVKSQPNPTIVSLSAAYRNDDWMPRTDRKQDICLNNQPIGLMYYTDSKDEKGCIERCLKSFRIENESLRDQGIGTQCMQQFIQQAQDQKVTEITLFATPRTKTFYERLGFQCTNDKTLLMIKTL